MIYHILVLILITGVSFLLATLVTLALVGFDLGWDLFTSKPARTAAGRDGQAIGCALMAVLIFGLTMMFVQGGISLLEPYMPKVPVRQKPAPQRFSVPYT